MGDNYDYAHVIIFPLYRSVLENIDFFTKPIKHQDQRGHVYHIEQDDDVIKRIKASEIKCKGNSVYRGTDYSDMCKKINKYLAYYSNHDKLKSKHFEYLNYWLNQKSKGTQNQHIYQNILNHTYSVDTSNNVSENKDTYKSKIRTLDSNVYKNIEALDKLNEHYLDFVTKKDSGKYDANKLCEDAKKFVDLYNDEVKKKCISNYDSKYCKALIEYRVKYNTQYKFTNRCENVNYLMEIPGLERYEYYMWRKYEHLGSAVSSGTDTLKIIGKVIAVALGLVFLAKFTPLGSILKGKKGKKKKSSKDEDEGDAGNANGDNEDDSNSQDQSDPLNIFNPNFYSSDNLPPYNEDYNIQYFAAPNYGRTHRR